MTKGKGVSKKNGPRMHQGRHSHLSLALECLRLGVAKLLLVLKTLDAVLLACVYVCEK